MYSIYSSSFISIPAAAHVSMSLADLWLKPCSAQPLCLASDLLGHQAGGVPMGRLLTATPNEEEEEEEDEEEECSIYNI